MAPPPPPSAGSQTLSGDAANRPTPERRIADSLPSGLLLAFTGGALDSFLYLTHGRVFAGAMTGNAVLCGIALLSDQRHEALQHLLPLIAFALGVFFAELLQDRLPGRLRPHAVSTGLACETLGLLACSFLPPTFPNLIFVPLISFLAAYQVASFRQVDTFSYNSTFITGDLRTALVGLYRVLRPPQSPAPPRPRHNPSEPQYSTSAPHDHPSAPHDHPSAPQQHPSAPQNSVREPQDRAQGLRQARDLGLVILLFLLGAVSGALLSPHLGNRTLWLPVITLAIVLALTLTRAPHPPDSSS